MFLKTYMTQITWTIIMMMTLMLNYSSFPQRLYNILYPTYHCKVWTSFFVLQRTFAFLLSLLWYSPKIRYLPPPPPPLEWNGSTKNCTVIGGSTKNCTVIGQLIGEALGELGEAIGELAKPSAKASSTSSAATAINMTAQIDV